MSAAHAIPSRDTSHRIDDRRASGRPCRVPRLLLAALLWWSAGVPAAGGPPSELILGVHPYLSHSELQVRFEPLADYLAKGLGRGVKVRVGRDYAEHIDEVGQNHVDIAYLGPISYVRMVERYGDKPLLARLARNGRAILEGYIVVPGKSPLHSLTDLRGRSFAFGEPDSTMSSVVPQATLAAAGISLPDLGRYVRYHGHNNVALAVLSGQMDAGAVKSEVFDSFNGLGLRALAKLPEVSEHLFVTRSDMPEQTVVKLRQLMLDLAHSRRGLNILKSIHRDATALVAVDDHDYDNLRDMLKIISESDEHTATSN